MRAKTRKRTPRKPRSSGQLDRDVDIYAEATKLDIFLAALDLASLCNDAGSADDHASTNAKLREFINVRRAQRKAKPI